MNYSIKYDLIFVTTHQNNEYIYKLLNSIVNLEVRLLVLILSQETSIDLSLLKVDFNIELLSIRKTSLSKARNIGLEYLRKQKVDSRYIMFPDDDSTFDLNFFNSFNNIVQTKQNYIIPIYCENSEMKLYLGKKLMEGQILYCKHHYMIGSPNQIINYENNVEVLYFDEELGVGAKYGSCEDYDLFVRLLSNGQQFQFTCELYNYHPDKSNSFKNLSSSKFYKRITSYSLGFIYVVKKHKLYSLLPYFFTRPILASFYYLLRFNFKLFIIYFKLFFFRIFNFIKFVK